MSQNRFKKSLGQVYFQKIMLAIVFALGISTEAYGQFRPNRPDFFEQGQEQIGLEIERLQQQRPQSIPALERNLDSLQWSAVLLREGGGVVWMPQGFISHDTKNVENGDDLITFNVISSTTAIGRFVIAFSGKVDSFANDNPNDLLDRVRTHIVNKQTSFVKVSDYVIAMAGNLGQEFTLKNNEEVIKFRILLIQDRLYVMAVSQAPDSEQTQAITTFFNSFRTQ